MKKILLAAWMGGLLLGGIGYSAVSAAVGPVTGEVWVWGGNSYGQLGIGTVDNYAHTAPLQPIGLGAASAIAAGAYHGLALKPDGTVWAWGGNWSGQLGDGTNNDRYIPAQIPGLTGVQTIVGGGYQYSLALKTDGTVWAWGENRNGELGDGTNTDRYSPVQVVDPTDPTGQLTGVSAIAAAYAGHSLAVKKADGSVWSWGWNSRGQLGDGTNTDRSSPVQVIDQTDPTGHLTNVIAVASGQGHSLALKADGTVWAWGFNYNGQLGNGNSYTGTGLFLNLTPVQAVDPTDPTGHLTGVIAIAAGQDHSLALKADGTVWAWGSNWAGQLGNGGTDYYTTHPIPMPVIDPLDPTGRFTGVITISATEGFHNLALKKDGTVWSWGSNIYGELGDGTTINRSIPVRTSGLAGVCAIAAGGEGRLSLAIVGSKENPCNSVASTTIDLFPTAITATFAGSNIVVQDAVKNQGTGSAGSFTVSYYLIGTSFADTGKEELLCSRNVSSLAAGATDAAATTCAIPARANVLFNAGTNTSRYYLLTRVDSADAVSESAEGNNTMVTARALVRGAQK